jgi:gliding motility-associated-like protein
MKNKLNLIVTLVLGIISISRSQSIPIQVINSAGGGGTVGSTGVVAYYNIGETVINTNSSSFATVTQGFLQPDIVGNFGLTATPLYSGVSCLGKKDGVIKIIANMSGVLPANDFIIHYYWEPPTICPTNDCSTVTGLVPGTYSVLVISQYIGTVTAVAADSVSIQNLIITDNTSPCLIEVFNGMTPNHDGHNDYLHIDNIGQYPDNEVDIYNRWGQQLAHITGYDNVDKRWNGTLNGSDVLAPTGTYFYVISLGDKSKPIKGWIELLHE